MFDLYNKNIFVSNLTSKHVAGSIGGAASTIAVSNAMRSGTVVMGSGFIAIGGGIAVKQMDECAGDAFMLTRLDMISREISPGRPGKIQQDIKVPKSIYDYIDFYKKTSNGNYKYKEFLSAPIGTNNFCRGQSAQGH